MIENQMIGSAQGLTYHNGNGNSLPLYVNGHYQNQNQNMMLPYGTNSYDLLLKGNSDSLLQYNM
jgi:hypothetical protein